MMETKEQKESLMDVEEFQKNVRRMLPPLFVWVIKTRSLKWMVWLEWTCQSNDDGGSRF